MNKKNFWLLGTLGVLIVLASVLIVRQTKSNPGNLYGVAAEKLDPSTQQLLDDPNYTNILLPENLDRKVQNKESFFVYYFSPKCPHCLTTTPILQSLSKEFKLKINQFNLLEYKNYIEKMKIEVVPTLIFYKKGKESARLTGGITEEGNENNLSTHKFKSFLKKHRAQVTD